MDILSGNERFTVLEKEIEQDGFQKKLLLYCKYFELNAKNNSSKTKMELIINRLQHLRGLSGSDSIKCYFFI